MPTPTRSWRQSTGRISALATASISGVVGYALRNSAPSILRMRAMASMTFTDRLLSRSAVALRRIRGRYRAPGGQRGRAQRVHVDRRHVDAQGPHHAVGEVVVAGEGTPEPSPPRHEAAVGVQLEGRLAAVERRG